MLQCRQESGDVLFVPEAWGHAVLNVGESVGVASEFQWGMAEFAIPAPGGPLMDEGSDPPVEPSPSSELPLAEEQDLLPSGA